MGKHTNGRKRSSQRYNRSRSHRRKSARRKHQSTFGLWLLLIGILLAMGAWALTRIPPGQLILTSITILVVILLFLVIWFLRRYRLMPEERSGLAEQRAEHVRMEETAYLFGARRVELADLAHLTHEEFEYFTGVLLEAMGEFFDWERVGGSGDHGIDLRGKNRHGRPMIVQCKHIFSGKVAPDKTRDFGWALGLHSADDAWFVTTAPFTSQARADVGKLTYLGRMKLVDGEKLMEYLWRHWDALPDKWQWRLTECAAESDRRRLAKS
jgi:hypothetical protein